MVRNRAPEDLEVPDSMLTHRSGMTLAPAIVAGPAIVPRSSDRGLFV
jgi:hypothetical protein